VIVARSLRATWAAVSGGRRPTDDHHVVAGCCPGDDPRAVVLPVAHCVAGRPPGVDREAEAPGGEVAPYGAAVPCEEVVHHRVVAAYGVPRPCGVAPCGRDPSAVGCGLSPGGPPRVGGGRLGPVAGPDAVEEAASPHGGRGHAGGRGVPGVVVAEPTAHRACRDGVRASLPDCPRRQAGGAVVRRRGCPRVIRSRPPRRPTSVSSGPVIASRPPVSPRPSRREHAV
jgi:hypothetical protein